MTYIQSPAVNIPRSHAEDEYQVFYIEISDDNIPVIKEIVKVDDDLDTILQERLAEVVSGNVHGPFTNIVDLRSSLEE